MTSLEQRAFEFANFHHTAVGQRRKYTNDPYIVHPAAVAALVRSVDHTDEMLAAAWLHDTVEDTFATLEDIHEQFGGAVGQRVALLTDCGLALGNREARKRIDRERLVGADRNTKTIKLADLIDNSRTITQHDPGFARTYMAEKRLLLESLQGGNLLLWDEAYRLVQEYFNGIC
jgi:(p)ppGpp synthase/HD superfamily hydrolase